MAQVDFKDWLESSDKFKQSLSSSSSSLRETKVQDLIDSFVGWVSQSLQGSVQKALAIKKWVHLLLEHGSNHNEIEKQTAESCKKHLQKFEVLAIKDILYSSLPILSFSLASQESAASNANNLSSGDLLQLLEALNVVNRTTVTFVCDDDNDKKRVGTVVHLLNQVNVSIVQVEEKLFVVSQSKLKMTDNDQPCLNSAEMFKTEEILDLVKSLTSSQLSSGTFECSRYVLAKASQVSTPAWVTLFYKQFPKSVIKNKFLYSFNLVTDEMSQKLTYFNLPCVNAMALVMMAKNLDAWKKELDTFWLDFWKMSTARVTQRFIDFVIKIPGTSLAKKYLLNSLAWSKVLFHHPCNKKDQSEIVWNRIAEIDLSCAEGPEAAEQVQHLWLKYNPTQPFPLHSLQLVAATQKTFKSKKPTIKQVMSKAYYHPYKKLLPSRKLVKQ